MLSIRIKCTAENLPINGKRQHTTACPTLPHFECLVPGDGNDEMAIRTHCTSPNPIGMAGESEPLPSHVDIPHLKRRISLRDGNDEAAIGTHHTIRDFPRVVRERGALLSGDNIPHLECALGGGDDETAVRTYVIINNFMLTARKGKMLFSGGAIPYLECIKCAKEGRKGETLRSSVSIPYFVRAVPGVSGDNPSA